MVLTRAWSLSVRVSLVERPSGYVLTTTDAGANQDLSNDDHRFLRARGAGSEDTPFKVVWVQGLFEELTARVPPHR